MIATNIAEPKLGAEVRMELFLEIIFFAAFVQLVFAMFLLCLWPAALLIVLAAKSIHSIAGKLRTTLTTADRPHLRRRLPRRLEHHS